MSDHDFDRLVQDVLDGTASPAERTRLETALATNPAAAARHDELKRMFAKLKEVPNEEVPAGLRAEVLNRLRAPGAREHARALGRARVTLVTRSTLRTLLPFALGFAAGVVAFVGWRGEFGSGAGSAVVGSMMPAGGASLRWREGRMDVTVRGERRGDLQILGVAVEGTGAGGVVEFRFDPARTRLTAFRQAEARSEGVESARDRLTLRPGARGEYRLELRQLDGGAPVVVTSRSESSTSVRTLEPDFGDPEGR